MLVTALAALAIAEGALRSDLTWQLATTLLTISLIAGLPWRRSHPLIVAAYTTLLSTGFAVAQGAAGVAPDALGTMLALLTVPYAVFRWGSRHARWIGGAVLACGMLASVAIGAEGLAGAIAGVTFLGAVCLAGALRRERVIARSRELDFVRSQEREALARDLHDTVAHHVSAIAIRAQAAAAAPQLAGQLPDSLSAIEHEAKLALSEMRSIVRTLRAPADFAPTSGLMELAALATPGPPVVRVEIEPIDPLPDVVAATLFRIAQEGVTNARRHAAGVTTIDVAVTVREDAVRIVVRNDGASARPASRAGHGIQGMSERVALLGGTLNAQPEPAGGWMLCAALPMVGAA